MGTHFLLPLPPSGEKSGLSPPHSKREKSGGEKTFTIAVYYPHNFDSFQWIHPPLLFNFYSAFLSFLFFGRETVRGGGENLLLFRQQGGGGAKQYHLHPTKKAFPPYPHLVAAVFFLPPFFILPPLSS